MVRPHTYSSLVLLAALATACSGGVGSSSNASKDPTAAGAEDPHSDSDGDGVIAADDHCPGTSTDKSKWADSQGCSESQDGDNDGLSTDEDLCPNTPAGEQVDGNGCSDSQKAAAGNGSGGAGGASVGAGGASAGGGGSKSLKDWQPSDDGKAAANGFVTFVLDPKGPVPAVLKTLEKNVTKLANGFELSGTIMVDAPNNEHITLAEAKVKLGYDSTKGEGLQSFEGTVRVPFPGSGFMQGVKVDDLVYASVGYQRGKDIQNVDAPLKDERKYFYFTFSAGLSASIGDMSISAAGGQSVTMTLDPSDPSFFLRASLAGFMGPVDDASVGFSLGGHLPFTPENTWGLDASKATFDGHMWIGGKLNLNFAKLPIAIGGNTVVDFDPNDDGKTMFQGATDGATYGSNAEIDVSVDAKVFSIELPIAKATTVAHVGQDGAWAMYSGKLQGGNAWMPQQYVPIKYTAELKVAGYASSDIEQSYFSAEGEMSLNAQKLGEWTGLNLSELAMVQASLHADRKGVLLTGKAATTLSPGLGLNGDVDAEAFFNGNPNDWYVTLDGQLAVKGIDLSANAHAKLNKDGLFVSGKMSTPISLIEMSGNITSAGVDLTGHAEVEIPIVAGKEVAQWVTDKAVCGAEVITDAAVCGYQTVTSGAQCGVKAVTSVAQCGSKTVTSAAQCGTQYVTSGAVCGYKTVTSAAQCGVNYFSDLAHCGWQCVSTGNCSCSAPKTCQVAASCNAPKTCSVAATCNVPNTCSVPGSCEKVKTCEQKLIVPDFDYGTFKGSVTVKIGNSGLYGNASGQYCPKSGSCTTIGSGTVKATSGGPEACVTIAGLGEFCAKI